MDIGNIRQDFTRNAALEIENLDSNPFLQFENWFKEALEIGMPEANAFSLATVNAAGEPTQRSVLLKFFDEDGFVFYTNYRSRKARDISQNPHVSMLFPWFLLQRQVKIVGTVEKVGVEQSLKYFLSRPRDSQLGAWASPQSEIISSRKLLLQQWETMKEKFKNGEIPLPDFWGGYRIIPKEIEFWQGQPNRLHDRFLYRKNDERWDVVRLAP